MSDDGHTLDRMCRKCGADHRSTYDLDGDTEATDTYADLRALAEDATPGPWKTNMFRLSVFANWPPPRAAVGPIVTEIPRESDAAWIAAANPARILALLADLAEARGEVGTAEWDASNQRALRMDAERKRDYERDRATAAIDRLRTVAAHMRDGHAGACYAECEDTP